MQGGLGAELVDLVMNLVENPGLVIVDSVVLNSLVDKFLSQSVDYFNLVELDHDTALGSTRHVVDSVSLNGHLHRLVRSHEGHLGVPARLRYAGSDSTSVKVHTDMTFLDLMETLLSEDQANYYTCSEENEIGRAHV